MVPGVQVGRREVNNREASRDHASTCSTGRMTQSCTAEGTTGIHREHFQRAQRSGYFPTGAVNDPDKESQRALIAAFHPALISITAALTRTGEGWPARLLAPPNMPTRPRRWLLISDDPTSARILVSESIYLQRYVRFTSDQPPRRSESAIWSAFACLFRTKDPQTDQ
jgi:hypothetical protein